MADKFYQYMNAAEDEFITADPSGYGGTSTKTYRFRCREIRERRILKR